MAVAADRERLFTITELARELGITPRAIRLYESRGLLRPQRAGTTRVYDHRDRGRLHLILRGKRLGFTLAQVQQFLDLYDADPDQHQQMVHLLRGARHRIAALERQRHDIEVTLGELREVEAQCVTAMRERGIDAETEPAAERKLAIRKTQSRTIDGGSKPQ
ncbi:MAG TPA: MerR family DNA-binding transcriptional regulator [Thermoanaerobaculia bacterium]|nr:MerR family DNA-binding transcriptional regulator [Thermoanaerobaculia bacterium]